MTIKSLTQTPFPKV